MFQSDKGNKSWFTPVRNRDRINRRPGGMEKSVIGSFHGPERDKPTTASICRA
jgi:hypothetical protein